MTLIAPLSSTPGSAAKPALDYEVITVPPPGTPEHETLKQQCFDVRIDVFVHEQGFELDTEIDEFRSFLSSL